MSTDGFPREHGMAETVEIAGVNKFESTLLVLFIPSVDRDAKPIDQHKWEMAALEVLGKCFGGATAFPKGRIPARFRGGVQWLRI